MKICPRCKKAKDESSYNKNKARKNGLYYYCRQCNSEQKKEWVKKNPEKIAEYEKVNKEKLFDVRKAWRAKYPADKKKQLALARKWKLRTKYGLSIEEFNEMVTRQGNACAVCKKEESAVFNGVAKRLAVDHCHETGKVRGLLCQSCNIALGNVKDNIKTLNNMIDYLNKAY